MKRKLASIQIVKELIPIEGADFIEECSVEGWGTIVKKGDFKVEDRCVWFEIDSILPAMPWSEFLEKKKYRVKTMKMRGVLSQGVALPLSILNGPNPKRSIWDRIMRRDGWKIGADATDFLGVRKFDEETQGTYKFGFNTGKTLSAFPAFVPKTDETRIQSCLSLLHEIKGLPFYASVKLDGTSATFAKRDNKFYICSRGRTVQQGEDDVYNRIARLYDIETKLPDGLAIQGEICGPGIRRNRLGLKDIDFFLFDVFDISAGKYLGLREMTDLADRMGLKTVPIDKIVVDKEAARFEHTKDNWLELAKGKYVGTKNNREGLVVRPLVNTYSRRLRGRLSFKIINNDYLLKEDK